MRIGFSSSGSLVDKQICMVHVEMKSLKLVNCIGFIHSTVLYCETLTVLNALLVLLALICLVHKEPGNSKY